MEPGIEPGMMLGMEPGIGLGMELELGEETRMGHGCQKSFLGKKKVTLGLFPPWIMHLSEFEEPEFLELSLSWQEALGAL